jgi:gliding motility-associated-like protein
LTITSTDESCFGACDGTAAINISGGVLPYNPPVWGPPIIPNGQGTDSIWGLCAGLYTVTVTDANNCPASTSTTVNPQTSILANLVTSGVTCNGFCDGSATISPTGGVGPYTVSWDGGSATISPTGGVGPYTVSWDGGPSVGPGFGPFTKNNLCGASPPGLPHFVDITDANGCTETFNFNIVEFDQLNTYTVVTDVSCFGLCDGSAITNPSDGTGNYIDITWDSIPSGGAPFPFTGNPINNLCPGTYYVTITDDSLCTVTDTITVLEPSEVLPNAQFTDITCNGYNNGTATALPTGGVPGYTYFWTTPGCYLGPVNTQSINGLCPGQYIVTVTDSNGCTGMDTINITDPSPVTVVASATNASCGSVCDGVALATPGGGTGGTYSYNWMPGNIPTNPATNLCAGIYTVTVTDSNGCSAQDTTEITNLITIPINTTLVGISCNGLCDGTATATPVGGQLPYTFLWTNGDTTATADSLCPGWAYVTVTDANGCVSQDSVNMPVDPSVLLPNATIDQAISCPGACDAQVSHATTGGTPPYSYTWFPLGIDTMAVCPPFAVVTVTDDNGCIAPDTLWINDPTPILPNEVVVNVPCFGDSTGSITLAPTGGTPGYTYSWVPTVSTGPSATGLPAGTYVITVTDSNLCDTVLTINLTQSSILSTIPIGIDVSCFGACDGIMGVIVNGGTPPYTYSWALNPPIPPSNDTIFNVCAPFLSNNVTVIDSNGCVASQLITISEPAELLANVTGTPISCSANCDGTALSTPSGGTGAGTYTYQWSANALPNILTNSGITNLCADSFYVVVTDTNGCTANGSYIVTAPSLLNVTLDSTNVVCIGNDDGTATATPVGGTPPYSYAWVGGCLPLPGPNTNATITNLCPGIYTVTVTDSFGCIFIGSVNIIEPSPIDDNEVVTHPNCGVSDGSICMFPSGGVGPYTHSWSTGDTTICITNLIAGFYTDTITDSQGCIGIFTIGLSNPIGPSGVTSTVNDATCYGVCDGSLNVIVIGNSAPYTYSWTGPPPFAGSIDSTLIGLCAGTYDLTVTDSGGCILTTSVVVGEADSITANSTYTDASCSGNCDGSASVTPTGGTPPYTYSWSTGSTSSSASNLCVGLTSVTITDFNGCTKIVNFNITSPNALTVTSTFTDALCNGVCDGTATATPLGGTSPYNYQWDDPLAQTTATATGLCAGTYIVIVTDFNGCSGTDTVIISEPTLIVDNTVTTLASCGNNDGTATAAATGGTGPYSYYWPAIPASTPIVPGLGAGTYVLEITDDNGCMQSFLIPISNIGGPTISVNSTNASCNGVCDGTGSISVISGTPNYSYLWTAGGQTSPNVTGLCAGNYTAQVTDGNGCITVQAVTITDNSSISATVSTIEPTCNGDCNGSALVVPSGGTPPYSHNWSTGHTINAVGGLCAGTYYDTITDAAFCSYIQVVTINEPNILSVSTSGFAANCYGSCDGEATATPLGGTAPYTYLWSTNATTPTITALCAGTYFVTVTDVNGCSGTSSIVIGNGIPITATINTTDANCGLCDGSITVTGAGGAGSPYTYLWSIGGQTTPTITNLCPGAYNVDITDNVGCTQSFNILINNANGPTLTTLADSVSCFGACDGMAWTTVNAGTAPFIYQWDDPGPPGLTANDTANNLCAGLYNIVVQDSSGCVTVDSVTVFEPQQILANITFTNPSCIGVCDGTATVNPSGGVGTLIFSWSNGQSSATATGLCADSTYFITITDGNGCSIIDSIILSDPTPISITISSTSVSCNGDCDGTALATASGGTPPYTYSWNTTPPDFNSLVGGLCSGTYTVTVTDANLCTATDSVQVIDPPILTTTSTSNSPTCYGVCDGTINTTPSGGVAPYTYIWNNGATTDSIFNLCPDTFTVIVVDANNCTAYDTIILLDAPLLNDSTIITGPSCGQCDGYAISTPVGGVGPYDFVWTDLVGTNPSLPSTTLGQPTDSVGDLCAGSINLQLTDLGSGCTYNYTYIVNSITGPTLTLSSVDESCPLSCDGSATVVPSGGFPPYSYSWTPAPIQVTQTATNLCAGTYTITVTDSLNCISVDTITINSTGLNLAITSVVPESCYNACDGSATVSVTNGTSPFTYLWNPTSQITPTATNLCVGTYMVTVTDSILCVDSISTNITGPDILTVTASINTPISCNGICDGAVIASPLGGTPPYSYSWNSIPTQPGNPATGLCAGTYIVTVTDDNNCTAFDTITLTEPSPILANDTIVNPACGACDGSIAVIPTGGVGPYTYLWTTPSSPPILPQPITNMINNLCAGAYSVIITDQGTGCFTNFNFPLSNDSAPAPNISITDVSCYGMCDGQMTSSPTGGTPPYSYLWNPGNDTSQTINNLCPGQYDLIVTDSAGCVGIAMDSIAEPGELFANIDSSNVSCFGGNNGWAVSNPYGGTAPYNYNWMPGSLAQDSITNLVAGTYTVTVTDTNNCIVTDSVTLTQPTLITATDTIVDVSCISNCDGAATVTPTGGTPPYTYQWNGSGIPDPPSMTGLCFGLNYVEITDDNGCIIIDSIYIGALDTIMANAGLNDTICLGDTLNLIGVPTGNFTSVEWFEIIGMTMTSIGTSNTVSISPIVSGCYAFQVNNGACTDMDTICITVDPLPIANAGPDVTIFEGTSTTLNASGGGSYSWTPGTGLSDSTIYNPVATPDSTIIYYLTVTSSGGCVATDSVIVTVLPIIEIPNGISPNGDGSNDTWIIDFIEEYPDNVVEIYNRWGELLYHADGYDNNKGWDGTYNGKELPIGTYYYIIDLHDDEIKPFTGPITILR